MIVIRNRQEKKIPDSSNSQIIDWQEENTQEKTKYKKQSTSQVTMFFQYIKQYFARATFNLESIHVIHS